MVIYYAFHNEVCVCVCGGGGGGGGNHCVWVCLDIILRTAQPFVTKLGTVVHIRSQCHVKNWAAIFKVKVKVRAH